MFHLRQCLAVTKKAAVMENGLKLRDLKRCRDTRPRASLGKAGIRLGRWGGGEVGPNRFRITFSARTLYIHPVGWCALLWCTRSVSCLHIFSNSVPWCALGAQGGHLPWPRWARRCKCFQLAANSKDEKFEITNHQLGQKSTWNMHG